VLNIEVYKPESSKSIKQLSLNITLYLTLYLLAIYAIKTSYVLFGLCALSLTFILIRIFVIQHDCTHYSFWKSQKANNLIGIFLGGLTHIPHQYWSKMHRQHHGTSGNLDKREYGDIWVLTVDEYKNSSTIEKLKYRIYRSPLILMFLGGFYLFFIRFKNPFAQSSKTNKAQKSIWQTNALIAARLLILSLIFSWEAVLLVECLALYLGSAIAVLLFYLQHNYAEAYWQNNDSWDYTDAALKGSSYLNLGKVFHWLTSDIGYHHIHHLDPRVPNYLLSKVDKEVDFKEKIISIGYKDIIPAFQQRLWDEQTQSMVKF